MKKILCLIVFCTLYITHCMGQLIVEGSNINVCDNAIETCPQNLIVNGDFENGDTNFLSDYTYTSTYDFSQCARYTVGSSPYDVNPNWVTRNDVTFNCSQNTCPQGNSLICRSQCSPGQYIVWKQTIDVDKGQEYVLKVNVSRSDNSQSRVLVSLFQNGQRSLVTYQTNLNAGAYDRWEEICVGYTSETDDDLTLEIEVIPVPLSGSPNVSLPATESTAFAIDEISLRQVAPTSADFGMYGNNCPNQPQSLIAEDLSGTHLWIIGADTLQGPIVQYSFASGNQNIFHSVTGLNGACSLDTTKAYIIDTTGCLPIETCVDGKAICGSNIAQNPKFNDDFTGFQSGYAHRPDTLTRGCGGYVLFGTNAADYSGQDNYGSTWDTLYDHTGDGQGKFAIFDSPCSAPTSNPWQSILLVNPGETYYFEAWFANLSEALNTPSIELRVDGNSITAPTQIDFKENQNEKWVKICGVYVATGTFAQFEIILGASFDGVNSGDFGLDDILIQRVSDLPSASFVQSGFCAGEQTSFTSPMDLTQGAFEHYWDFGDASSTTDISTQAVGTYNYYLSDSYGIYHRIKDLDSECERDLDTVISVNNCCDITASFSNAILGADSCQRQFIGQSSSLTTNTQVINSIWSVKDGDTQQLVSGDTLEYAYQNRGLQELRLSVVGQLGGHFCEDDTVATILTNCENECDIEVGFEANLETVLDVDYVVFKDTSVVGDPVTQKKVEFIWSFGESFEQHTEVGEDLKYNILLLGGQNNPALEDPRRIELTVVVENNGNFCSQSKCMMMTVSGSDVQFTDCIN